MKYVVSILVAIALCAVVWFNHPEKDQVKQLENQISNQYFSANKLLRITVQELLKWDFSQPLTNADEDDLKYLYLEWMYITDIIFNENVVHHEWRSRMFEIETYISHYVYGPSLTAEDVADLHQALQATLFISMDFNDYNHDFYDAMHDEQHEMVEKIKSRLDTQY